MFQNLILLKITEKIREFLKGTPKIYHSFWGHNLKHDFVLQWPWCPKLQSRKVFTVVVGLGGSG